MNPRAAIPLLAVFSGAGLLAFGYLAAALRHAGPYASLPEVRVPVSVGLFLAYAAVLAICGLLFVRAAEVKSSAARWSLTALWAVGASLALFLAPALPYLLLAGICHTEALCPQAANPIGWALSGLAASRDKPFASSWATVALVLFGLAWRHWFAARANEA